MYIYLSVTHSHLSLCTFLVLSYISLQNKSYHSYFLFYMYVQMHCLIQGSGDRDGASTQRQMWGRIFWLMNMKKELVDSDGSRISPRWGRQLSKGGCSKIRVCQIFPKKAMNLKEFGPGGSKQNILWHCLVCSIEACLLDRSRSSQGQR